MSIDRRIGLLGLIVASVSVAAFYLWPDKKWIGWTSLGIAISLVVAWIVMEVVHLLRRQKSESDIAYEFHYDGRQAILSVTNHGKIADVWASLKIDGLVQGASMGMFARWVNTDEKTIKLAKSEMGTLILATRRLSSENAYLSQWETYRSGDPLHAVMPAVYTNVIGNESATPDIHLYINLFSDPDGETLPKECHVVLRSGTAELGD